MIRMQERFFLTSWDADGIVGSCWLLHGFAFLRGEVLYRLLHPALIGCKMF